VDYLRETARTESVYGLSRVERIILRVNQALRKQDFDLARFTDGSTPLGIIKPPAELQWTPEQLRVYEQTFNGMLAGNDQLRVRARALPPGSEWQQLTGDDPLVEFDRFLLNVTVAAFGLTMDELGFTDTSNRSVGQSQEAIIYRRAVAPVTNLIAGYLTRVVRRELDARFTVSFAGIDEPDDFASRAEGFARLIPTGAISPSDAARLLKLPVRREIPAYVLAGQQIVLVDELVSGGWPMSTAPGIVGSLVPLKGWLASLCLRGWWEGGSNVRVQGPDAPVRVYPNRAFALLGVVLCLAYCVVFVWILLDHSRPPMETNPLMYEEPWRSIIAGAGLALFGALALRALYFAVTPWPLVALDAQGLTYRVPPFRWGAVRWDDLELVVAGKRRTGRMAVTILRLDLTLSKGALASHGGKGQVKLTVPGWLLGVPPDEVVRVMRQYHTVTLLGGPWRDLD
jgi:hypothetical protein